MASMMFLSARPVRAATLSFFRSRRVWSWFLSARPVRAATPGVREALAAEYVSIRATRAGRDMFLMMLRAAIRRFYPRDPCGPRRRE